MLYILTYYHYRIGVFNCNFTYYSTTLSDVQLESSPAKENQFEQHPPSSSGQRRSNL